MAEKIAVVLFNLGGPDAPEAVQPFLFNLFNDKAIIALPQPLRWCLATLVSHRRAPVARKIYDHLGGSSPLLGRTRDQARALEAALADCGELRCFIAMRYWHPMSEEAVLEVKDFAPDRIVLLPLYPQFSTTTSASSFAEWHRLARVEGLDAPTHALCCYATDAGLIEAHAALIRTALATVTGKTRILFSAHGLPKKIVERGDPYVWQIERSAEAIAGALAEQFPDLDWRVCYQSRVGPLEWVGPSTEDELRRAGGDRVAVVVVPIAFVSEHSETLVELDVEYRASAEAAGVVDYVRVPALGVGAAFIDGLAGLVRHTLAGGAALCSHRGGRICPAAYKGCPHG
ncbi:MAG: ferrochelatase [Proteobacteria bacterium]|nr:ferrochelatase [Pseudomonadota bacterium]